MITKFKELGKILSKEELKQIKGGTSTQTFCDLQNPCPPCTEFEGLECILNVCRFVVCD